MFTGIIEDLATVVAIKKEQGNIHYTIKSAITPELKIDQSIAHNGVCLTVIELNSNKYVVTAIKETLQKTNLNDLKKGDVINIERAMKLDARLDGHIVQGHVDQIGICTAISNEEGSWKFTFTYDPDLKNVTIEKGSITVNGTSLTVINSTKNGFSVAIIPYTYENTAFKQFSVGTRVNLEFDVIGKYVKRLMEGY